MCCSVSRTLWIFLFYKLTEGLTCPSATVNMYIASLKVQYWFIQKIIKIFFRVLIMNDLVYICLGLFTSVNEHVLEKQVKLILKNSLATSPDWWNPQRSKADIANALRTNITQSYVEAQLIRSQFLYRKDKNLKKKTLYMKNSKGKVTVKKKIGHQQQVTFSIASFAFN